MLSFASPGPTLALHAILSIATSWLDVARRDAICRRLRLCSELPAASSHAPAALHETLRGIAQTVLPEGHMVLPSPTHTHAHPNKQTNQLRLESPSLLSVALSNCAAAACCICTWTVYREYRYTSALPFLLKT